MTRDDPTAEAILAAATRIAARSGANALRTRAVAAEAGVAVGTPFFKFGSREGLLVAALERAIELLAQQLDRTVTRCSRAAADVAAFELLWARVRFSLSHPHEALLRAQATFLPEPAQLRATVQRAAPRANALYQQALERLEREKLLLPTEQAHRQFFSFHFVQLGFSFSHAIAFARVQGMEVDEADLRRRVAWGFRALLDGCADPASLGRAAAPYLEEQDSC